VITTTDPHYAVRIRFSVYLHKYEHPDYEYPLSYSLDSSTFSYIQSLDKYFNYYDIITSEQVSHRASSLTVSFINMKKGAPYNNHGHFSCNSKRGLTDFECPCAKTFTACFTSYTFCNDGDHLCSSNRYLDDYYCCEPRYIEIKELLVFISKCQTGCLSCNSLTDCTICDQANGYYLYPEDNKCYKICPQATYQNFTTTFLNNPSYPFVSICAACDRKCMECSVIATNCSICYPYGRN